MTLENLSFTTLTTAASNLWDAAKSYVFTPEPQDKITEEAKPLKHSKTSRPADIKRLLILSTIGLFNATRNQTGLSLGLATLFIDSVSAAYPTVANPIPIQYAQPGQAFSYDIDLNYVFNDADGDIMTFGGVTMVDGSPLQSWLTAAPGLLGTYDTPGRAYGVAVQNGVAHVADDSSGLQLINVSNASAPSLSSTYNTPGVVFGVAVQNGVAYAADNNYGLQLINVSKASAPRLLGTYNTPGQAFGVAVQNGVAYVADFNSGLQLINVSYVSAPSLLGAYDTPGNAYGVTVQDGVAYVVDGGSGLQLINVSNASAPSLLSGYDTPGTAHDVVVQNGIAYVADDSSGLQLIDVSNTSAPSLLGSYNTPGAAYGVAVQNGVAYVADLNFGLQIINVSNASVSSLLGNYDISRNARGVAIQNGVAYVADYDSGLHIIGLKTTRLNAVIPFNATGNYSLRIYATNVNGEWISTDMQLRITNMTQPSVIPTSIPVSVSSTALASTSLPTSILSTTTNTSSNPSTGVASSSSVISDTETSLSSTTSTTASQNSASTTFSIITSSTPLGIEAGVSTVLTTEYLSVLGNADPNQIIYTVQSNNLDMTITVNGLVATQFTQADVEGNFVEIALNGVTCGDYSTNLQLEANVAGSNAPAQQVSVSLVLEASTCTDAGRLSVFSFRDVNIGFWAQKREKEQDTRPVQSPKHIPTLR